MLQSPDRRTTAEMLMTALEQLAQFLVDHGHLQAMQTIAESPLFADNRNRCAAMYGFAQGIGLTESDGLDPAWLPSHPAS